VLQRWKAFQQDSTFGQKPGLPEAVTQIALAQHAKGATRMMSSP
jgi:hypothetical protein